MIVDTRVFIYTYQLISFSFSFLNPLEYYLDQVNVQSVESLVRFLRFGQITQIVKVKYCISFCVISEKYWRF